MRLVFDVGASKTRLGLEEGGELIEVVRTETDRSEHGFEGFCEAAVELLAGRDVGAAAGGFPGQFAGKEGVLTHATNLPKWEGATIGWRLKKLLGCDVLLRNDAVLCGLGECHAGAGRTKGVMAYFTISTGVNAVRIVDGRVDESISRYEIGKQLLPNADGKLVTLESLTGGAALSRRLGRRASEVHDRRTWRAEERQLALGLYNTILHWTPELVVFGGGMMADIDLEMVWDDVARMPQVLESVPRFERAKLGDLAGLHGAAAWLEQQQSR